MERERGEAVHLTSENDLCTGEAETGRCPSLSPSGNLPKRKQREKEKREGQSWPTKMKLDNE